MRRSTLKAERNAEMVRMYLAGVAPVRIGQLFNVSRWRVCVIIERELAYFDRSPGTSPPSN